jgi:centromeric protein E
MFGTSVEPGVLPLAVRQIFNHISSQTDRQFLLRVSFMEIYNEIIKDLLKPGNDNLKVHQNPNVYTHKLSAGRNFRWRFNGANCFFYF